MAYDVTCDAHLSNCMILSKQYDLFPKKRKSEGSSLIASEKLFIAAG